MRGIREMRSKISAFSVFVHVHVKSNYVNPMRNPVHIFQPAFRSRLDLKVPLAQCSSFCSLRFENLETDASLVSRSRQDEFDNEDNGLDRDNGEETEDSDDEHIERESGTSDECFLREVRVVVDLLRECGTSRVKIKEKLDHCGVKPSNEVVAEVLSRVRNDWETAFTFFVWAGNQEGYTPASREYHSMISILCKMRKFDTAWALIDEMRRHGMSNSSGSGTSLVNRQTLLIIIRRYCAVHDVGKAINTFHTYKRFKLETSLEDFQSLLSALCRYKNVQDAEHLMFCNRETYPIDTKSFNIILNGWCNIIASPREAERVWREMGRRNIRYDVVSFSSMMSCYSKSGNLHRVLRLFSQMKKLQIAPDRKVYNALVHALAKARFVAKAMDMMKKMEESGLAPNIVTYNSLIKPLCKARKIEEAKSLFDEMLDRGLSPTIQTYHAFIRILRNTEEIFDILEKMGKAGCEPNNDTYIMLIRKFCRWRDFDNVYRIWNEMNDHRVGHDRSAYAVLIHGLFLNGELDEAYKFYTQMIEKGFVPEPNMEEMMQSWILGKEAAEKLKSDFKSNELDVKPASKKSDKEIHFLEQPQTRKVIRERGFSLWDK